MRNLLVMATRNEALCPSCNRAFSYEQVHTGFNNTGYAYCHLDGKLLVWDSYDPTYTSLVGRKHPWTLTHQERRIVEQALRPCPCGGRFGMDILPKCPHCLSELPDLLPDRMHFAVFDSYLDPTRDAMWEVRDGA